MHKFFALVPGLLIAAGLLMIRPALGQTPADVSATVRQGGVGVIVPLNGGVQRSYEITAPAQHGEVAIHADQAAYTPRPDFVGTDTFSYAIHLRGGAISPSATVTVTVERSVARTVKGPAVAIAGNRLVDATGKPFLVKGLIVRPVIAPFYLVELELSKFNHDELSAAHAWGANTVRLLVNQSALDPLDPFYSRQFVLSVANAAQMVIDSGFVLIIGINDEIHGGNAPRLCLPTAATQRGWRTLLTLPFAQPRYRDRVMLELFNEPVSQSEEPYWWHIWQDGGRIAPFAPGLLTQCTGGATIGMNQLIAQLRAAGAGNIIIADGLGWAHWLNPLFPLDDPLGQIAYAAHPFLETWPNFTLVGDRTLDVPVLDAAFGDMQRRGPVIATAVGGGAESAGDNCQPNAPQVMPVLLDYLRQRSMGAVAWVFDMPPNALTVNWDYEPTSYAQFTCPLGPIKGEGGPGILFQRWFQSGR